MSQSSSQYKTKGLQRGQSTDTVLVKVLNDLRQSADAGKVSTLGLLEVPHWYSRHTVLIET